MAEFIAYGEISVPSPEPTGDAGQVLSANFQNHEDRIAQNETDITSKANASDVTLLESLLAEHTSNSSNPHSVSPGQIGTYTSAEIDALLATVEVDLSAYLTIVSAASTYATQATVTSHTGDATIHRSINDAGTATTDLWSASKISSSLLAKANATTVNTHLSDTANPHSVTAAQVGSYTTGEVDGLISAIDLSGYAALGAANTFAQQQTIDGGIVIGGATIVWNSTDGTLDFEVA